MRRTLILTLSVLVAALLVCAGSMLILDGTVEEAERLQSLAVLCANEGDFSGAKNHVLALAGFWERRASILETLAEHDALHDVASDIAQAQICLECEDHDDFLRTMAGVRAGLEHLRDEEALRWSNLY